MPANALLDHRKPKREPDPTALAVTSYNEGGRLRRAGKLEQAIACYDRALKLRPAFPEALRAGADILREQGKLEGALHFLDEAIRLQPTYLDAVLDRGNLLCAAYRYQEALATFEAALAHSPGDAGLLTNLGVALHGLGHLAEALDCLETALAADAQLPQAHLNYGNVLARLGRHADALLAFDGALALAPAYPAAHANRGLALTWLGRFDEAATALDAALALDPANAYARTNRGKLRLLHGDYERGLPDYEQRLQTEWQNVPLLPDVPLWAGQDLAGLRVLAFADQGSGDVIHFSRYVPLLCAASADVTVICRARLQRLIKPTTDGARVVAAVADSAFDVQIPFSSLPYVFETRLPTIPATVPYLRAEADRVAHWAARLGGDGFRVGLCWQGNQDWRADPHRSLPIELFEPLSALPGVRLISLQATGEDGHPTWPLEHLVGLDDGPDGFLDTAAVIAQLDLVVTCDTSIAHLSGALACPTYLLLQPVPEWRWMLEREDTPWYPTIRLFRQHFDETWKNVVERVVETVGDRAVSDA